MPRRERDAHIFPKAKHGHYVEPAWCSQRLLNVELFLTPVLDPACGWGTIVRSAYEADFDVIGYDIVDRRQKDFPGLFRLSDFLKDEPPNMIKSIICNPPFDYVEEFCRRACEVALYKVAMLCLWRRLPAARWLQELPLETIYMLTPRPSMPPGSYLAKGKKAGGGTQDFCWLVFNLARPPHSARPPILRWLHRDGGGK